MECLLDNQALRLQCGDRTRYLGRELGVCSSTVLSALFSVLIFFTLEFVSTMILI